MQPTPPPQEILAQLGPTITERVFLGDQTFLIQRPSESDRLLNHPAVHAANAVDDYMPYWADLWPAARMLAKALCDEQVQAGEEALEIGCGLGLPGVVAPCGLRVTFSDYDAWALHFASVNARLNGFNDFRLLQLDWRDPPADLRCRLSWRRSDLRAAKHRSTRRIHQASAASRRRLPAHGPGPHPSLRCAGGVPEQERLAFTTQTMRAGEPGGRRLKGTLYRIRHPG